jgi:hypothetical protein
VVREFGSWVVVPETKLVNLVGLKFFAVAVLGNFVAADTHLVDPGVSISSSVVAMPTVFAIAVVVRIVA